MTKGAKAYNEVKIVSSVNGVEKIVQVHTKKKNEIRPPTYTIQKNKLEKVKRLKHEIENRKNPRSKRRQ